MVCCHLSPQLNVVRPSTSLVVQSSNFVSHVMGSMSINIHYTHDMTRLSYTNAVSVNYFLSVCAGCKVSRSCVITILNELPKLTAFHFAGIRLPANEMEVSMHNVQMQCIHVCAVTQSAQHACVYIVSCARGLRNEGVSSTFSQVSWPWIYQF